MLSSSLRERNSELLRASLGVMFLDGLAQLDAQVAGAEDHIGHLAAELVHSIVDPRACGERGTMTVVVNPCIG